MAGGQGLGPTQGAGLGAEGAVNLTRLNFDDSDDEGQGLGGQGGKMVSKGRPPANPTPALVSAPVMTLSARGNNPNPVVGQGLGQGLGQGVTTAETKKKMVPIKTFSVDF